MSNRVCDLGVRAAAAAAVWCAALGLAASAQAQVKLELKRPPGRVVEQTVKTRTQQTLTLGGMPIETEGKQTVVVVEATGAPRDDGSVPVSTKFESFKAELALPGGLNINFDSARPDAKIEPPTLAFLGDVFRLISRFQFTVVLDKAGAFQAAEGLEAVRAQAEKLEEPGKAAIIHRLSADRIKQDVEQDRAKLPDVLVRPGDSWDRTEVMDLDSGQTLTFRKKYEYLGTETKDGRTFDKIGVKAIDVTYGQNPNVPTPLRAVKSELKVESESGTILFDREGGIIVRDEQKNHVTGSMTFDASGREVPATLDLTLESKAEARVR